MYLSVTFAVGAIVGEALRVGEAEGVFVFGSGLSLICARRTQKQTRCKDIFYKNMFLTYPP